MSKNTGRAYEIIVQKIFDSILNQDRVTTIEVKRNVTLIGKTISHEIDVYWEFELGGIKYMTVVQAKDWAYTVNQGELLKFKAVLDDLPGQPRGVFVTRTGYQEGAFNFAKANGVFLYELCEIKFQGKHSGFITVVLDIYTFLPHTTQINLVHDVDWMIQEGIKLKLSEIPAIRMRNDPEEVMLYSEQDSEIMTIKKLTDSFYPAGLEELLPTRILHEFEKPTFIKTGVAKFPRLKLNAIEATITVNKADERITFELEDFATFVLRNVFEGTEQIFDKDGKLLKWSYSD